MSSYRNIDGKVVARRKGELLMKNVRKSKHMFRQNQGWGFDEHIIVQAVLDDVEKIKIHETETGTDYLVDMKTFTAKAQLIDYGHGKQYVLAGRYWTVVPKGQESFGF